MTTVVVGVVLAVVLAFPGCRIDLDLWGTEARENGRRSVTLRLHDALDVVGLTRLIFDHVAITAPGSKSPYILLFSGGRDDIFPEQVQLSERDGAIDIRVRALNPFSVTISDEELRLIKWWGPLVVNGGRKEPLWSMIDALDCMAVIVITVVLVLLMRRGQPSTRAIHDRASENA